MTFITIVAGFVLGVALACVVGVVSLLFFYNNYLGSPK
jgi:ABC-type nitrate/sulfonate/bicarbonate transport system permease component